MYIPLPQVFLDELSEGQLLLLCQGVNFPWDGCWGVWLQLYGVIPEARSGESLSFFLSKDFGMTVVFFQEWLVVALSMLLC